MSKNKQSRIARVLGKARVVGPPLEISKSDKLIDKIFSYISISIGG